MDGSVNFYRPWNQYKRGFWNVESEYWLGLENMYQLTRNRKYMLRVDLEDFDERKAVIKYANAARASSREAESVRLHVLPACTRILSPIGYIQPQPMSNTPTVSVKSISMKIKSVF
ncbi:Microfibril-associated glycoprotein 4 [Anabarilius grahami]|uniref:Microfibril-associated glycoprotein 4 n=1 Tax=Anabarilius grahami TaxID=495550 RepID=A0A3N0Z9B4_ANAGA|nr:Microfibril-associated glycoprotein 4 [Anabarilius grahami]